MATGNKRRRQRWQRVWGWRDWARVAAERQAAEWREWQIQHGVPLGTPVPMSRAQELRTFGLREQDFTA